MSAWPVFTARAVEVALNDAAKANKKDRWTMFLPEKYNYPLIDGLLGGGAPVDYKNAKGITRIAIQVTLQQPHHHAHTLEFFRGAHLNWEPRGAEGWCMLWVTPPPGDEPPSATRSSPRDGSRTFHHVHYSFGQISEDLAFLDG